MKSDKPDSNSPSRLAKHLALLELDGTKQPLEKMTSETAFINAMVPLPLHLRKQVRPARSRKLWPLFGTSLLLAAAAVLFFVRQPDTDVIAWQPKGSDSIQIYVEQEGRVYKRTELSELAADARVKVEILTTAPSLAFWGVTSRDKRLLTDGDWIWKNRMTSGKNEKKFFSGSLQLDGANEGESVCAVICPVEITSKIDEVTVRRDIASFIMLQSTPQGPLAGCSNHCSQLRR